MSEIRIQKINGVEFVTLTDYLKLKEENKDLNKQIEQFKKGVKAGTNIIERLEEENQKLKVEINEWVNGAINSLRETPELLIHKE